MTVSPRCGAGFSLSKAAEFVQEMRDVKVFSVEMKGKRNFSFSGTTGKTGSGDLFVTERLSWNEV